MTKMYIQDYLNMDFEAKKEFSKKVARSLKNKFEVHFINSLPIFRHITLGLDFAYIPRGSYNKGFSLYEENCAKRICDPIPANIEEMRPVTHIEIKPLLVTVTPILNKYINRIFPIEFAKDEEYFPAYIPIQEIKKLCTLLNLRLPSEDEWEYFCRAGTKELFTFGRELPDEDSLESWLTNDLSDLSKLKSNNLGLFGIFSGEWCNDRFRYDYSVNSEIDDSSYVIRGGGAYFWPWQDEEWVWCMSAMRMPSKDLYDGTCGFRLVYELPNDWEY